MSSGNGFRNTLISDSLFEEVGVKKKSEEVVGVSDYSAK